MTSFTSRYGNPATDYAGAHIWVHSRHSTTVVTIAGHVDAANQAALTDHITRFITAGTPLVLDLSGVTTFAAPAADLIEAVAQRCAASGVDWALVPGTVVSRTLSAADPAIPVVTSAAAAEHTVDEAIQRRRRMLLPLLRKTA